MTRQLLPERVNWILSEHLTTVEQLEVLLFLRNHRDGQYDEQALCEALRLSPEHLTEALNELVSNGLVATDHATGSFRFSPRNAALTDAAEQLAVAYREHSAAVLSTMSVHAIERIRSGPLRAFADSFVLGGKKRDG